MIDKAHIALHILLLLLLKPHLSRAQFQGCPQLSDPGTLAHLIAHAVATTKDPTATSLPSIVVRKNHTVCLSVGPDSDTVSSMSVLVEYECCGHTSCSPQSEHNTTVEQFDFGCISHSGSYAWSARQFGKMGSRVPSASFSTALRRNCSACIEKGVAETVGIGRLLHVDPTSRCLGKFCRCKLNCTIS